MTLLIVIFSFAGGFMYAIEPSSQEFCEKEAAVILAKFTEKDKTKYYGGCVLGGILLNIKKG